jgi:hypothetical protein
VLSLFCYDALLCLHQCLPGRIFLNFMFFFSIFAWATRLSLPFSYMYLCSIFSFCVLCSVHHFHSMRYASSVRFSCYAQHASSCMNNYQKKQQSLLCSTYIYHAKSSARSHTQLFVLFGNYVESVLHQWLLS